MDILVVQKNFTVGDLKGNADKIIEVVQKDGPIRDLIVFTELCVTGYPPLDLLDNEEFIREQTLTVEYILNNTRNSSAHFVIGYLEKNDYVGKPLFNSLAVCYKGKIVYNYRKRLLPTYDIFDEDRYFEPGDTCVPFIFQGKRIGFAICEDLWPTKRYHLSPVEELCRYNSDLIISINASPSIFGKHEERLKLIKGHAEKYGVEIIYANQVGGNDDIVFDGNSFCVNSLGRIRDHAKSFEEDEMCIGISHETVKDGFSLITIGENQTKATEVLDNPGQKFYELDAEFYCKQAVLGIRDYLGKNGFKKVVIGESGGIDSAVTTAIAARAVGPENVIAVTMPSKYSSNGSVDDSQELCDKLGVNLELIPIKEQFETFMEVFDERYGGAEPGVTEQNVQARIRGQILMAISNREGALVLSTGNKSELSVGYCVSAEGYIFTDYGMIRAEDMHLSNKDFYIKKEPITHSFRSVKNKQVVISTLIGNQIKISEDHKIKIIRDNKSKYVKYSELEKGDRCVISFGENIWGSDISLPYKYNKKVWDFKSQDIKFPQVLDGDLAKYLGICVADGSFSGVGDSIYRIRTKKDYVASFCVEYFKKLGLKRSSFKITEKDNRGCFFIETYSVQWHNFLKFLGLKHGSHNKSVPESILRAPKVIIEKFITGVLLDSTSNYKKNRSEILYHSMSKELAKQVHLILLNLGIISYLRNKKKLNEVYIPPSEGYKLASLDILKQTIKDRASNNIKNHRKIKTSFDEVPITTEELESLIDNIHWSKNTTIRRHLKQGKRWIGRETLRKYINFLDDRSSEMYTALKERVDKKELYAPIIESFVVDREEYMYDFTVSKSHEYSVNGVLTHNCTIYGDMSGGINPIADCYKMEVYAMGRFLGVPDSIMDKEPSAELAPGQVDKDNLPPYPVLDAALKFFIEGEGCEEAIRNILKECGWEQGRLYRMLRNAEFKRRQAALGVKMHKKSFGFGRRYPIVNKYNYLEMDKLSRPLDVALNGEQFK